MVAERTLRFQGKNRDLRELGGELVQHLRSQGYAVQTTASPNGTVIQAAKAGILRDIVAADRVFSILIWGEPNDFSIRIGIGKFIQNLAVTAVEAVLLSELFLAVDVPEMLWTKHVENQLIRQITEIANRPGTTPPPPPPPPPVAAPPLP